MIYFVSVANKNFYAKNVCEAVETALYFFIGINIEYPCECDFIWEFLQLEIFDVPLSSPKRSSQLEELIRKLGKK